MTKLSPYMRKRVREVMLRAIEKGKETGKRGAIKEGIYRLWYQFKSKGHSVTVRTLYSYYRMVRVSVYGESVGRSVRVGESVNV